MGKLGCGLASMIRNNRSNIFDNERQSLARPDTKVFTITLTDCVKRCFFLLVGVIFREEYCKRSPRRHLLALFSNCVDTYFVYHQLETVLCVSSLLLNILENSAGF